MTNNADTQVTLEYHEQTKHSYFSIGTSRHYLDWDNKPLPFKIYKGLQFLPLPLDFPRSQANALLALAGKKSAEQRIDLDDKRLAEILFFTAGITRTMKTPVGRYYFRAAPATGALYPIELYIVSASIQGLEAGVYHFNPGAFSLAPLRRGDFRRAFAKAADAEIISTSPVTVIFSSIAWRNAWKYQARSYRHWYWDAGTIVANLLAIGNALGLHVKILLGFKDEEVNRLLGLDGRREAAIALGVFGNRGPSSHSEDSKGISNLKIETEPLSTSEVEYPEIYRIHEASSLRTHEELATWRKVAETWKTETRDVPANSSTIPMPVEATSSQTLEQTILMRGSTRNFSRAAIQFAELAKILSDATQPIPADFLADNSHSLVGVYLIVNNVETLHSGAYYCRRKERSLELIKRGEFRGVAGHLCLDQNLGADASVVTFLMTNLGKVLDCFGNRGYRATQFEAGIMAGRIHLSAYAMGLGASGLTFYDDAVTEFFWPNAMEKNDMIVVAVGVPAYKARPGRVWTERLTVEQMLHRT